jgi:hypothetical protein
MYNCIPIVHGELQAQTLTHAYQDFLLSDVFQNVMSNLFQDMKYVKNYLDDLLILRNNSEQFQRPST